MPCVPRDLSSMQQVNIIARSSIVANNRLEWDQNGTRVVIKSPCRDNIRRLSSKVCHNSNQDFWRLTQSQLEENTHNTTTISSSKIFTFSSDSLYILTRRPLGLPWACGCDRCGSLVQRPWAQLLPTPARQKKSTARNHQQTRSATPSPP